MELFLNSCCCDSSTKGAFDLLSIIKDLGPIIIAGIALWISHLQNKKTLQSKQLEEKRSDIYKKLNEFYGPIIQLRKKSNLLYQKFSEEFRNSDPNFATLPYLLTGGVLTSNQKILLQEILKIGEKTENLIHDKAGLIDVKELRLDLIPKATAHFLIMRLAFSGALQGDAQKYGDMTFPRDLDAKLEERKSQLEQELRQLNS